MSKRKSLRPLKSVPAVIKARGGLQATANWLGVGKTTVSNWATWGFIPPGWFVVFDAWFRAEGYEVDRALFQFKKLPSPQPDGEARHVA